MMAVTEIRRSGEFNNLILDRSRETAMQRAPVYHVRDTRRASAICGFVPRSLWMTPPVAGQSVGLCRHCLHHLRRAGFDVVRGTVVRGTP